MRVVLAEDNALLRAGVAELLRLEGFDIVAEVGDGDALLEAVRTLRPDVALVDVRMPPTHTVEGLAAARQIRAELGEAVGILVLSEHLRPATPPSCSRRRAGASGTCSRSASCGRRTWRQQSARSEAVDPRSTPR